MTTSRAKHFFRNLFRKRGVEQELDEEMQSFVALLAEEKTAAGMAPDAARRAALLEAGGVEQIKEEVRATRTGAYLEEFFQDLRFGLRMLRRTPGVSIVVIVCLTLAIGANAAVFSWIEGILLRPYPLVSDQERLVALAGTVRGERDQTSWLDLLDV